MQWLAEICVHRPVFATVIVMFLTVVGGFSFFTLGVDRFPKIDLSTVSVRTSNPGAAPEEIESEITDVIEGALNTVPGVEEMRSSSSRGSSNVTLTFNLEKDPDQAYQEIQQKLSTVVNRLPETADPPVAQKADPDSQPILMYTISAPRDVMELTEMVENLIQERIESADGVGEVFMWGARGKQVKIYVDPNRLRAYNLPVTEVSNAIRSQNQELPGGNLIEGARTLGLRTMSKLTEVEQFNDIVITTRNGFPVKIRDIGRVEEAGQDPTSAATLDGVRSVSIGIRKQSGANTIDVINNVKARMATIVPTLPADMRVALLGSGGLSHEPGGARYYFIDEAFDRHFLDLCARGDHERLLREMTVERMDESGAGGTCELLAWFVVLGAIGKRPGVCLGYTVHTDFKCGIGAVQWQVETQAEPAL